MLKSVFDALVNNLASSLTRMLAEPGWFFCADWVHPLRMRCAHAPNRRAARTARGTADLLTHHGSILETREPGTERRVARFGKPPSPAMSRSGDGVSVVVRARESRVHGEGRQ